MTIAFSIIYALTMFVFVIIFFVAWYRSRQQVSPYKSFGFSMGAILVGFELIMAISIIATGERVPLFFALITDTVAFFRMAAFTIMGMYYCSMIGLASFPLIMQKYGVPQIENRRYLLEEDLENDPEPPVPEIIVEETAPEIVMPPIQLKRYFADITVVVLGSVIFSSILFLLTSPQISSLAKQYLGINSGDPSANDITFLSVLLVLEFAFAEELVFRLGIQNFLAKSFGWFGDKYWIAILITTTLWTLGHAGIVDPDWVKLVQVFPIGIALGWLFKKYGVESSIIAHMVFNLAMLIPSQYLLSY